MNKQIAFGVHKPLKIQNENVRGILLKVIMTADAVNTDVVLANLDLTAVSVGAKLKQHGYEYDLLPGKIEPVLLAKMLKDTPAYKGVWPGTRAAIELVTKAAAVKGVHMVPIFVDFGHIINLDGDDTIELDVFIEGGAKPANAEAATSYVEVESVEGIGIQSYVPMVKFYAIEAGANAEKINLPENTTKITFINKDKTDQLLASRCISSIDLKSDKLNLKESFETLLAKREKQFDTAAEAALRYQSFCIHDGIELSGGVLNLSLVAANITASNNYVVVEYLGTNGSLTAKADAMVSKFQLRNRNKMRG